MNSNLISKNISGYFDELINKPILIIPQKESSIITFYKNYVEHNLLLIIIIIFIIIFLLFKYYTKDCENITDDNIIEKNKIRKKKEQNKKLLYKINKERELLEKEKSEILSIIDELSEINYKKIIPVNIEEQIIKSKEQIKKSNEQNYKQNKINYNKIDYEAYTNNQSYSDDYYDIKENKSELIDGIYFETPYN